MTKVLEKKQEHRGQNFRRMGWGTTRAQARASQKMGTCEDLYEHG